MFGPLSLDISFFTSSQLSFTKVRNPEALGSGFTFQSVLIPLAQLFFKFFTHDLSPVCQSMSKVSGLSRRKVSGNTIQTHGQCDNGQSSRSAWTLVTWVKIRITLGPAKTGLQPTQLAKASQSSPLPSLVRRNLQPTQLAKASQSSPLPSFVRRKLVCSLHNNLAKASQSSSTAAAT